MECQRCFPIHGPGCPASYLDSEGHAVCVWCADGLPCAAQLRILKQVRSPNHNPLRFAVIHAENVDAVAVAAGRKPAQPQEDDRVTIAAVTPRNGNGASNGKHKNNGGENQRRLRAARQATTKPAALTADAPAYVSEPSTPSAQLRGPYGSALSTVCREPGCGATEGLSARTGFCREHRFVSRKAYGRPETATDVRRRAAAEPQPETPQPEVTPAAEAALAAAARRERRGNFDERDRSGRFQAPAEAPAVRVAVAEKKRDRRKGGDSDRGFYLRLGNEAEGPANKAKVKAAADKLGIPMNKFAAFAAMRFVESGVDPALPVTIIPAGNELELAPAMAGD